MVHDLVDVEKPVDSAQAVNVPSNEVPEWWASKATVDKAAEETTGVQVEDLVSENGVLRMFWLDIVEIRDRPGKLYLIGKIKDNQNGYQGETEYFEVKTSNALEFFQRFIIIGQNFLVDINQNLAQHQIFDHILVEQCNGHK